MTTARVRAADLKKVVKGSNRRHEDMVQAALQLLALHGVPATPIHTGARVAPRAGGGFDLRTNRAQVGFGDIAGALPPHGRMLIVECKTGNARRTPAQVRLHERYACAGALCVEIRNVTDLVPHLQGPRALNTGGNR